MSVTQQTVLFKRISAACFLLAGILLVVSSVTAPALKKTSLITIKFRGDTSSEVQRSLYIGAFGYCYNSDDSATLSGTSNSSHCTGIKLGYKLSRVLTNLELSDSGWHGSKMFDHLPYGFAMHPFSAGLSVLAAVALVWAAAEPARVRPTIPKVLVGLATFNTLIAVVVDVAILAMVRDHAVELPAGAGSGATSGDAWKDRSADMGAGLGTTIAAFVVILIAVVMLLFQHFVGSRRKPMFGSRDASSEDGIMFTER